MSASVWPAVLFLLVAIVVIVVLSRQSPAARRKRVAASSSRLEREYERMLHMPPKAARETMSRILADMEREYPGRSRQWLLKKMIADLQRDRQ